MRKIITVFLTVCFLGQSMLFANPNPATQKPKTLAEYRDQVKQILIEKPWIKTYGISFLSTAGVTTAALFLQKWQHLKKAKIEEEKKIIREIAERSFQQEFQATKTAYHSLRQEHANLLAREEEVLQRSQHNYNVASHWQTKAEALEREVATLQKQKASLSSRLYDLDFNFTDAKDLDLASANSRTFAQKLSMGKELTEAELKMIVEGTDPELAHKIIQRLKQAPKGANRYVESAFVIAKSYPGKVSHLTLHYLRQMLKNCKTIAIFAVIIAGFSSIAEAKAKAQNWERRLNINFALFANASDEELKEMERLGLDDLCIEGAESIILMNELSKEEQNEIIQTVKNKNQSNRLAKPKSLSNY